MLGLDDLFRDVIQELHSSPGVNSIPDRLLALRVVRKEVVVVALLLDCFADNYIEANLIFTGAAMPDNRETSEFVTVYRTKQW